MTVLSGIKSAVALAAGHGVTADQVSVQVSAGSVVLHVSVAAEASVATTVQSTMSTQTATPSAASAMLSSVTVGGAPMAVASVVTQPVVAAFSPPPPPPASPPSLPPLPANPPTALQGWSYDAMGRLTFPEPNPQQVAPTSANVIPGTGAAVPVPRRQRPALTYDLPPVCSTLGAPCTARIAQPAAQPPSEVVPMTTSINGAHDTSGFGGATGDGNVRLRFADVDADVRATTPFSNARPHQVALTSDRCPLVMIAHCPNACCGALRATRIC